VALNSRPRHGWARQVLGEDRSRQPMIGAAVHDGSRSRKVGCGDLSYNVVGICSISKMQCERSTAA
jgi:hypothetical protein